MSGQISLEHANCFAYFFVCIKQKLDQKNASLAVRLICLLTLYLLELETVDLSLETFRVEREVELVRRVRFAFVFIRTTAVDRGTFTIQTVTDLKREVEMRETKLRSNELEDRRTDRILSMLRWRIARSPSSVECAHCSWNIAGGSSRFFSRLLRECR